MIALACDAWINDDSPDEVLYAWQLTHQFLMRKH
jgi:hypothetical protein